MNAPSDEPLQKVLLNLFYVDYLEMKRRYGYGYTEKIRELVRQHLRSRGRLYQEPDHD